MKPVTKRGPEPERVRIETDFWGDAVAKALQKSAPARSKKKPIRKKRK